MIKKIVILIPIVAMVLAITPTNGFCTSEDGDVGEACGEEIGNCKPGLHCELYEGQTFGECKPDEEEEN